MAAKGILSVCGAAAALAVFLVVAIFIPTFDMSFYRAEYGKYGIPRRIGVSEEQLMGVTERLTGYMLGRAGDLSITAEVNGVTREFFDGRDKAHMVDVKELFDLAKAAFALAACVFTGTWAWALKSGNARVLARVGLFVIIGFVLAFAALAGVIALDFDRAFTQFHLIFFDNDLWMLDPNVSLLVNIVPLEFFVDIAIRVGAIFLTELAAYAGALIILLRRCAG